MRTGITSFIFDHGRVVRIKLPESVFCEGKPLQVLNKLALSLMQQEKPILLTRLKAETLDRLDAAATRKIDFDPISETGFINGTMKRRSKRKVAVVAAGSADLKVATEACRTLTYLGIGNSLIADVGVAGLWRLTKNLPRINRHSVIIAVAGMDAALVSVLGGLTSRPLIAVPTSCGYGVAEKGISALQSMLASCSPGIPVMNIDNGYGAACAAARILSAFA